VLGGDNPLAELAELAAPLPNKVDFCLVVDEGGIGTAEPASSPLTGEADWVLFMEIIRDLGNIAGIPVRFACKARR
jgi:hypothetical protein